jgi:hypothetical protein
VTDGHAATEPTDAKRRADLNAFRVVTAGLALSTVAAAALIIFVHEYLRLSTEDARGLASALLLIGMADTWVLYFWDRIFRGNCLPAVAETFTDGLPRHYTNC